MFDRWRRYNQSIIDNLEDDEEEELVMRNLVLQVDIMSREEETKQRGGNRRGRRANKEQRAEFYDNLLYDDYFAPKPIFDACDFRRVYRMRRSLFLQLLEAITRFDDWFVQRPNAAGKLGLSSRQKGTATMRMLAYGTSSNSQEEYNRMAESTAQESILRWCRGVHRCFSSEYLREPTQHDIIKQMEINQNRGWPGMFGSIDCMHWKWKLCPVALQWSYNMT